MSSATSKPLVVLVTGAAGGLGQALVRQFAESKATVIAGWHLKEPTWRHPQVVFLPLDVTKPRRVEDGIRDILDQFQAIDVLVNNAGTTSDNVVMKLSDEAWNEVLDVNLKGAFTCCKAVLPSMVRRRRGHIINVSSFSGRAGRRGQANYASAKAGLLGLTTALAKEVGGRNIKVNAILPGVLPTPMTESLPSPALEAFAQANALHRLNDPVEVARFVVFLSSMENVSGQLFQLDSRISAWS